MRALIPATLKSQSICFFVILTGILIAAINLTQVTYSNFSLTAPSGATTNIAFPLHTASYGVGVYTINGTLTAKKYASTKVQIIPDDELLSLSVNNQQVDLSGIPAASLRDYSKGFIIDLKPYIHAGDNALQITYTDTGGMMGVKFKLINYELIHNCLIYVIALLIAGILLQLTSLQTSFKIIFLGALAIRIFYFTITPYDTRGHDMDEHFEYIEYLTEHWIPPDLSQATGGAYFHPPLYYYSGALVYKAVQLFSPQDKVSIYRGQQLLSLAYTMGFVFFGLLILQRLFTPRKGNKPSAISRAGSARVFVPFRVRTIQRYPDSRRRTSPSLHRSTPESNATGLPTARPRDFTTRPYNSAAETNDKKEAQRGFKHQFTKQYWCTAVKDNGLFWTIGSLFAFWPVSIIHSVRIGNDPMEYFLFTASLYFIIKWFNDDKTKSLLLASLLGAAAIVTKASGEVLIVVLTLAGLYRMLSSGHYKKYITSAIAPYLILLLAVAITVTPGFILMLQGKREKLYIDNINNVSQALQVGNTAANYFWFDTKIFITEPFTSPWEDSKGRQFFWNYLGKTGLFGEFNYGGLACKNAAVICSFFAVLMTLYCLFGLYRMTRDDFSRQGLILISGALLLASITYVRMTFPVNIDFRYVVPLLVTFCALYGISIQRFQRLGATRVAATGVCMSILFTLSAIVFVLAID